MRREILAEADVSPGDYVFLEGHILCLVEKITKKGLLSLWVVNGAWKGSLNPNSGEIKAGGQKLDYSSNSWYKVFPTEWCADLQKQWYYR